MLTEWAMEELTGRKKYIYEVSHLDESFATA